MNLRSSYDRNETQHNEHRKPGLLLASLPLAAMTLLLGIGYGIFHLQAQVLLIAAAVCAGLVGWRLGYSWEEMQQGIVESVRKAVPAILIMLCVGMLIAAWMASGTIPMLLYYGLKLVSPRFFLVTACAVCSLTSLATGTSWGTVGTIGVAFIGIAQALQVPLGPAAGAIVAGAYFGDKLSPFSDITNLAPDRGRLEPVRQHPPHALVGRAGLDGRPGRLFFHGAGLRPQRRQRPADRRDHERPARPFHFSHRAAAAAGHRVLVRRGQEAGHPRHDAFDRDRLRAGRLAAAGGAGFAGAVPEHRLQGRTRAWPTSTA